MSHRRRLLIAVPALLIVAATVFLVLRRSGANVGLEATGTVEATEAALGFTVAGRLESVTVQEGDTVSAGQQLAWLERGEMEARREQAVAQVAAARAQLAELERGSRPEEIAQSRAAELRSAQLLAETEREVTRVRALIRDSLVSEQEVERATTALDVARANHAQAVEALRLVEQGPRRERVDAARALLKAAEASVRSFEATLGQMIVRAPFRGVVTVRHHEPGEILTAGAPVVTVLNRDDRWVTIYIPETRVGAVQIGQSANVVSDTFRDRSYSGVVAYIAAEAEFTPKSVQTREERVKLVYAVKVRITGDPRYELKPGMPADVTLEAPAS